MYKILKWILASSFFSIYFSNTIQERPFVIIIPSYNNIEWYEKNLDSILGQRYENYRVVYIDDCSTDGTYDAVMQYVADHKSKIPTIIIRNSLRKANRSFSVKLIV